MTGVHLSLPYVALQYLTKLVLIIPHKKTFLAVKAKNDATL